MKHICQILVFILSQTSLSYSQSIFDVSHAKNDTIVLSSNDVIPETIQELETKKNPFEVSHVPIRVSSLKENRTVVKKKKKNFSQSKELSTIQLIGILLLNIFLFGIVFRKERKVVSILFRSVNNLNVVKEIGRANQSDYMPWKFILYFLFVSNLSLFICFTVGKNVSISLDRLFIVVLLCLILIYSARHLILNFIFQFFGQIKDFVQFSNLILVINLLLGIFFIPLNLLLAFGPEILEQGLLYLGYFLLGIFFIIRYLRGYFISSNLISNNLFEFFLYFCTFEIAPVLIGVRLISDFGLYS